MSCMFDLGWLFFLFFLLRYGLEIGIEVFRLPTDILHKVMVRLPSFYYDVFFIFCIIVVLIIVAFLTLVFVSKLRSKGFPLLVLSL